MYLLIIIWPLIGAVCTGLLSYSFGKKVMLRISITFMLFSCMLVWDSFINLSLQNKVCYISLGDWITSELLIIRWGFLFDNLTIMMFLVVTTVSTLVHIYSISYMKEDPHLARFMSYLSLFTFFMLILVSADNFIQLFLGWEGVGLCSYLLISFWFTRIQANKAAIKAMIMNRIGDFGLFLGILTTFFIFRSLEFSVVFTLVPLIGYQSFLFFNYKVKILYLVTLLFFVGSVGKSAQIGLHTWLPDAMEGPTPVSALIHAATMVTAGVFLIIRCSPLFEYAPESLVIITCVGALTAFFAATVGVLQNDIKKVIAYSTCSQLGYMVFTCGLSNYTLSFFHLFNHAFFKALLFLGAGSVIHSLSNEQDMRKMGGLIKLLPFVYSAMLIGSLALMGFPFLAGFYSKDVILEVAFINYSLSGKFAYILGTISAFFTAFYSIRLIFLVFLAKNNSFKYYISHVHELDMITAIPLTILSICSIFSGYFFKDFFIGLGSDFFNQSIFIKPQNLTLIDSEFIPFYIKNIPTIFSIFGAALALVFYLYMSKNLINWKLNSFGYSIYKFLNQKWYIDLLYNEYVGKVFLIYGYEYTFKLIDKGLIEILGPKIWTYNFYTFSNFLKSFQSGYIYQYASLLIMSLVYILFLYG